MLERGMKKWTWGKKPIVPHSLLCMSIFSMTPLALLIIIAPLFEGNTEQLLLEGRNHYNNCMFCWNENTLFISNR